MVQYILRIIAIVLLIEYCFVSLVDARQFHVAVNGLATGNGALENPWSLSKGLSATTEIKPGDTLMIHGGIYKGNFTSRLTGAPDRYVVVMNYNNEQVVLDGNIGVNNSSALIIHGGFAVFKNLFVTNSNGARNSASDSNNPVDIIRCDGINIFGVNIKCVNLIVYDNLGIGIGLWSPALDAEIYGCIIYNNGWSGPSRGLGHNMYMQNDTGNKTIQNCLIFNAASQGINVYTEGGAIRGFIIDGNTFFNNGCLGYLKLERNLLIGGGKPAGRIIVRNNTFYHSSTRSGFTSKANLQLGYGVVNEDAVIENNYLVGGNPPFYEIIGWNRLTVSSNSIVCFTPTSNIVDAYLKNDISQFVWNQNNYYQGVFNGLSFASWRSTFGFDANSSFQASLPTQKQVFVRPNKYETGRAHVVIFNWERKNEVDVDLSTVLSSGSEYQVFDVQNLSGQPVAKGTWNGEAVRFPLNLTTITPPNGNVPTIPPHTGLEFGAYLVLSNSTQPPPPPPPPPVEEVDTTFQLKRFYPNPTPDILMVEFGSGKSMDVVVTVFDLNGKSVCNELFGVKRGENKLLLNLAKLASGLYIVEISAGSQTISCKVLKNAHPVEARQVVSSDD